MKVNEIFCSLQGEGVFTGTAAIFIRFSGCNRACSFCDTDFKSFTEMSMTDIVKEIARYAPKHVVLTGGEPAMQIDAEKVRMLKDAGYFVQIETNGSLPVPKNIDWVTCSPKEGPWLIDHVDELKIVYQGQDVEEIASHFNPKVKCLQPCSRINTRETIDYIIAHPWWRLSLQTHKYIDIR